MYVIKKTDSAVKEYYAGYEGGLDGGVVWIIKRNENARFDKSTCEAIVKQLSALHYGVEVEMVDWKGGKLVTVPNA